MRVKEQEERILELEPRLKALEESKAVRESYIKSLEFAHKSARCRGERLLRERDDLEKRGEQASCDLSREKECVHRLSEALEEREAQIRALSSEVSQRESYAKRYREINNRMSVEMDRMSRELEALRPALRGVGQAIPYN